MDKLAAYLTICTQTWGALCLLCRKHTWLEPRVRFVQVFLKRFFLLLSETHIILFIHGISYCCRLKVKEKLVLWMGMSSGKRFHKFDILNLPGLFLFFFLSFSVFTCARPYWMHLPIEYSYSTFVFNSNSVDFSFACRPHFETCHMSLDRIRSHTSGIYNEIWEALDEHLSTLTRIDGIIWHLMFQCTVIAFSWTDI